MRTTAFAALMLAAFCSLLPPALAAEGDAPARPVEIKRIPITIYPNNVIVVRGKMVPLDELKEHLAALVPDAKKPGVEVVIFPDTKAQLAQVSDIVRIAKEAGYTNVSYVSPEVRKVLPEQITILVSQSGLISVDGTTLKLDELRACLEKKVEEADRPKVPVVVYASRRASMKLVAAVTKTCRDAGFKDVVFQPIAE